MENASKALLIAGVLLITLALVSIIMVIFNKGREFNQEQTQGFEQKKITYHNSQFTVFEKKLEKSEFQKLIDVVIKNNINAEKNEFKVKVIYNGIEYTYVHDSKNLLTSEGINIKDIKHDSLDKFNCYTNTNTYGIIDEIHVNKI